MLFYSTMGGTYVFSALVDGQVDKDAEDYITQTLLAAIFKFRFTTE